MLTVSSRRLGARLPQTFPGLFRLPEARKASPGALPVLWPAVPTRVPRTGAPSPRRAPQRPSENHRLASAYPTVAAYPAVRPSPSPEALRGRPTLQRESTPYRVGCGRCLGTMTAPTRPNLPCRCPTPVCPPLPPRSEMWPKAACMYVYPSFQTTSPRRPPGLPYSYPAIPRPRPQRSSTAYPTRPYLPCSSRMHRTAHRPKVDICRLTLQPAYPADSSHVCSSHGTDPPPHAYPAGTPTSAPPHGTPTLQTAYPADSSTPLTPRTPKPGSADLPYRTLAQDTTAALPLECLPPALRPLPTLECLPTLQPVPTLQYLPPLRSPASPAALLTLQPARRTAAGCHCSQGFQWSPGAHPTAHPAPHRRRAPPKTGSADLPYTPPMTATRDRAGSTSVPPPRPQRPLL
jgi:hypothetical protein